MSRLTDPGRGLVYGALGGASRAYVTQDGIRVTDGSTIRVEMGRLDASGIDADGNPLGTFGLRATGPGGTVIIDGTSNIFKIVATGTLNVTGPNGTGAGGGEATQSTDLATGLTSVPSFVGLVEFSSGLATPTNHIIFDNSNGFPNSGLVTDQYVLSTEVVSTNQTRVTAIHRSRLDRSAGSKVFRYFILREAAF